MIDGESAQFGAELVAVHQLLFGREKQEHDRRIALERKAGPFPQAVDL
jgi:hypothetical protein